MWVSRIEYVPIDIVNPNQIVTPSFCYNQLYTHLCMLLYHHTLINLFQVIPIKHVMRLLFHDSTYQIQCQFIEQQSQCKYTANS